ncbi:hypothetical protein ABFA07_018858 [Porites harrisoni]
MSSSSALWLLLLWGNLLHYTSGSVITRQERSIRGEGDIEALDCAAIEEAPSKIQDLYWKLKGSEVNDAFGYCNDKMICSKSKSSLEDNRIQVLNISKGTLNIRRTLPQRTAGHTVTFVCEVHTTDNHVHVSEAKITYSSECPQATQSLKLSGSDPEVNTSSGTVVGKLETLPNGKSVYEYLGIPYAKPPVNKLRFARPQSFKSWPGKRPAKEFGSACPQPRFDTPNFKREIGKENEDCLFLNVFVPATSNTEGKMAVMVWIHGTGLASFSSSPKFRGFSMGSSSEYPAHVLAGYNDVIVVTFNYRLGILGFLSSVPGTNKTGNYGMFDQIQALTWVHDNIAYFGGDPDKVTVFGHGTGATSVALHLISPKPNVLFQRAIMQSGAASAPYLPRKASNESVQKLAAAANCSFDDNLITCLREKSAEEIISLQSNIPTKALMELSNPVVDDDFIVGSPQKRYQKKKFFDNVQIMAGFTTHESSLDVFLRLGNASQVSKEEFKNVTGTLFEGLTQNKSVEQLVQYQYADDSDTTARERMIDFQSDFMTVAPMLFEAKALRKAGRPVYFYVFEHRPDFSKLPEWAGAFHGADIGFVFGAPFANISSLMEFFIPKYSEIEKGLSLYIMRLWTDFAKLGDPNGSDSPVTWPKFSKVKRSYLALDVKPKEKQKYRAKELKFLNSLIPKVIRQTKG